MIGLEGVVVYSLYVAAGTAALVAFIASPLFPKAEQALEQLADKIL